MIKRVILIILFIIIGIFCIEIYIRNISKIDYLKLDYEIVYEENTSNNKKKLTSNDLYTYYFEHYDNNSYIKFSNNDKFSIIDAYNNGYLFLGDIINEINILREANYKLNIKENKYNKYKKISKLNGIQIYFYNIDEIYLINFDNSINDSLINLFSNKTLIFDYFIETLISDYKLNKITKKENEEYILYEYTNYNIMLKKDNKEIYFGNKDLKLK